MFSSFFSDDQLCDNGSKDAASDDMELEEIVSSTEASAKEKERKESDENELFGVKKMELPASTKSEQSPVDKSATPNWNAWLKAFGVPKKVKKSGDEEVKREEKSTTSTTVASTPAVSTTGAFSSAQSFTSPAPRTTRKASTGSTISERSSFSQDPDSPRVGIDERIGGAYPAPYPSPLGASPIMTSPKDDVPKPSSPFHVNGAIRVGFYQDTTTKSSPEKSCSPREQPSASPYSNYAQHLYVSTTTAAASTATAYSNLSYSSAPSATPQTTSLGFNNQNKMPSYFDQYKQPKSQDSDYNSSVGSNPNSPYQSQHSPYQSQTSPYAQNSSIQSSSPVNVQASTPTNLAPIESSNSPNSPYAESVGSYQNQPPVSPYQQMSPAMSNPNVDQPKTPQQPQQHSPVANYNPSPAMVDQPPQQQQQLQVPNVNNVLPNYHHSNPSSPYAQPALQQQQPHVNNSVPIQQQKTQMPQQTQPLSMQLTSPTPSTSSISNDPMQSQSAQQHVPPNLHNLHMSYSYGMNQHYPSIMDTAAGMSPMLMPTMANKSAKPDLVDDGQRELLNLDSSKPSLVGKAPPNDPNQLNKTPHGYDAYSMYDSYNKDMGTSKAMEMYNRVATMSFSKPFSSSLASSKLQPIEASKESQHLQNQSAPINPYQQQQSKQSTPYGKSSTSGELLNIGGYPIDNKSAHLGYNQPEIDPRYDMSSGYKPNMFGAPPDDGMNGCYYQKDLTGQNIYGKNMPQTSAVSGLQQMLKAPVYNAPPMAQNTNVQQTAPPPVETKPKRTRKKKNAEPPPTAVAPTVNQQQPAQQPPMNSMMHQQTSLHSQIHDAHAAQQSSSYHHQQQSLASNQGFQSYGLKPMNASSAKSVAPSESTAISLKTSSSIVPGSAFNFGPSTTGLGLGPGIYGENTSYLEDFRNSANPYYLPPTHRNPNDPNVDPSASNAAAAPAGSLQPPPPSAASPYHHQFIPHPSSRGTYPFMNTPLDTNPQFYQQYFREEYRQARMMLNQGILGHSSTPSPYPQPAYHPPIGMPKPYDAMNRPWFP